MVTWLLSSTKTTTQHTIPRESEQLPWGRKIMECSSLYNKNSFGISPLFQKTVENINCHNSSSICSLPSSLSPAALKSSLPSHSSSSYSFRLNCCYKDDEPISTSLAYDVLGVSPTCNPAELKAAFRAKVKKFHPDVTQDKGSSDIMIRHVIRAYEILSSYSRSEIIERECLDPFDEPECEAFDVFVNEVLCVGKGCPYSCVKKAPHAFEFSSSIGTARATSQGHGKDYQVQSAVNQCPRSCIYYVTPSQRIILEEILGSIVDAPYDTSAEADLLYSLIVRAKFENNRYQKPKKQPKVSSKHVDWF